MLKFSNFCGRISVMRQFHNHRKCLELKFLILNEVNVFHGLSIATLFFPIFFKFPFATEDDAFWGVRVVLPFAKDDKSFGTIDE